MGRGGGWGGEVWKEDRREILFKKAGGAAEEKQQNNQNALQGHCRICSRFFRREGTEPRSAFIFI